MIAGLDFEKKALPPRHDPNASADPESTVEPRGKVPRRAETSETEVPFRPLGGATLRERD